MARDRASIRIDMWGDDDWRDLTDSAQRLYMLLLSHPTLSYAGVAEWRPGRLAELSADGSVESVEAAAAELEARLFIVVDRGTEEVLVRSFVKHDGLMKQPKLVVSMTTAFAAVASRKIRQVIAFEVQKMRDREPDMRAWGVKQVETVLTARASSAAEFTPDITPDITPNVTPNVTPGLTLEVSPNAGQELAEPTTTATATSSKEDRGASRKQPEKPLPDGWKPSKSHCAFADEHNIDLDHEVFQFRAHAEANDRRQRNWNGAFTQWLGNAKKWSKTAPQQPVSNAWMARTETPAWMES